MTLRKRDASVKRAAATTKRKSWEPAHTADASRTNHRDQKCSRNNSLQCTAEDQPQQFNAFTTV